jgi:thymidylate synthase
MTMPQFASMDDVLIAALKTIVGHGDDASPRGLVTKEVLGFGFALTNPRNRMIANPARKWSLPLAIGEFCWHSSASERLDALSYYAPAWRSASADGERIVGSNYGVRIFGGANGRSQWERVRRLLTADPASRRAVLQLYSSDGYDLVESPDVACTLSCQFVIRDGRLHAFVSMRSNDVIWGLPYDAFLFSMLQERLALELGVELGMYIHFASSMHLYQRHYTLADRILASPKVEPSPMSPMAALDQLQQFLRNETEIRTTGALSKSKRLVGYWGALEQELLAFANHRQVSKEERLTRHRKSSRT